MDDHIHIHIISITIICLIFLLTTLPQFHCQLPPPPQQPLPDYSVCTEKSYSYSCGNLSSVFYPFWGNNRPEYCGGGDPFHLNCQGGQNTTTILIGSQNFTVTDIDLEIHRMRMKRTELAGDVCSWQFNGTYLSPTLFRYPPSVGNITIFYDCPSEYDYAIGCEPPHNATFRLGSEDAVLEEYPELRRCGRYVQVPVSLDLGVEGTINNEGLQRVIDEGFEVEYTVNEDCIRCLGGATYGDCWISSDDGGDIEEHIQRSCYYSYSYCPDGSASTTHCSAPHKR